MPRSYNDLDTSYHEALTECARIRAERDILTACLKSVAEHPDVPLLIRGVVKNELDRAKARGEG